MAKKPLFAKKRVTEAVKSAPAPQEGDWQILVVDDEPEVHSMTQLLLKKVTYKGRGLSLTSAHSSAEAKEILGKENAFAVIFLDVVMETEDAGLKLVRYIREDLKNKSVRIILRTGQPGQAPEESVIVDYDINDYKAKTELTTQKLFTATIAALRSYGDIIALEKNRLGLEKILDSSDSLFTVQSVRLFASGVLTQLSSFIGGGPNGILCVQKGHPTQHNDIDKVFVLAGAGFYEGAEQKELVASVDDESVRNVILETLDRKENIYAATYSALYIPVNGSQETVAYIHSMQPLSDIDRRLLEVFTSKISVGFANVQLYEELENRVTARTKSLAIANKELERLAMADPLTGAFNRRYFMATAEKEIALAKRHDRTASFLLLDIDLFKKVNDTMGHAAGDEALCALIPTAEKVLRESDVFGRIGGEEFAILLPETDLKTARTIAERLRKEIKKTEITSEGETFTYTVSIGTAELGPNADTVDAVMAEADKALYQAKENGRDQVV